MHLSHHQFVNFFDISNILQLAKKSDNTSLMEWMKTKCDDPNANGIYYHSFLGHYTWNKTRKIWTQHQISCIHFPVT
jgi:hypothetical protein